MHRRPNAVDMLVTRRGSIESERTTCSDGGRAGGHVREPVGAGEAVLVVLAANGTTGLLVFGIAGAGRLALGLAVEGRALRLGRGPVRQIPGNAGEGLEGNAFAVPAAAWLA